MLNLRIITLWQSVCFPVQPSLWLLLTFFSWQLVYNILPHFSFILNISFIQKRIKLFIKPLGKSGFYVRIAAGVFCITTALTPSSPSFFYNPKAIDVYLETMCVFGVLMLGTPTIIAFFARAATEKKPAFRLWQYGYGLA